MLSLRLLLFVLHSKIVKTFRFIFVLKVNLYQYLFYETLTFNKLIQLIRSC